MKKSNLQSLADLLYCEYMQKSCISMQIINVTDVEAEILNTEHLKKEKIALVELSEYKELFSDKLLCELYLRLAEINDVLILRGAGDE